MDSIKAQDIIRHIFKDEDKGVEYVTGLSSRAYQEGTGKE